MSKKQEPTYEELRKKYTDEEIAESFVLRSTLSEGERKEAEEEFRKLRFAALKNMSDEQVLQGELMRMRLLMQDYFKQGSYLEEFSFANQLRKYISLLHKTMSVFAIDIGLHKTKLSRIINEKENPNIDLMYRLEHHSGKMIPATYWYKLKSKQQEEEIRKDDVKRASAAKQVKNELRFKASALSR